MKLCIQNTIKTNITLLKSKKKKKFRQCRLFIFTEEMFDCTFDFVYDPIGQWQLFFLSGRFDSCYILHCNFIWLQDSQSLRCYQRALLKTKCLFFRSLSLLLCVFGTQYCVNDMFAQLPKNSHSNKLFETFTVLSIASMVFVANVVCAKSNLYSIK